MMRFTLTILEEHRLQLQQDILRDERERGALLICGRSQQRDPWTGDIEERFVVREVISVADNMYVERTPIRMTWSTTPFYRTLKVVELKNFAIAVVHSHPNGPLVFSCADDVAEAEIFQIAFNRLDSERPHLSIVMDGNGDLVARAYGPDLKPHKVELIRVVGSRWSFSYEGRGDKLTPTEFERQVRAFGANSTRDIAELRFGIVGGGGTGSAIASLLPRIGARNVALFDSDRVDGTNLNRLHFAKGKDANLRRLKVDVLGEAIAELGLPVNVARFPYPIDDRRCYDALRSCDVIFGCTDDHLGRNLLNRLAHFYLLPIIDLGLLIVPRKNNSGYDTFDGRVTVIQPGYPCQVCRGLINPSIMLAEALRRRSPTLYEERRRAGYVPDLSTPSPSVVTFTTELATMAVNELFQRLNGFRGDEGHCAERVRRFDEVKDADSVPGGKPKTGCKLCALRRYDGRGDMIPFLDMAE